MAKAQVSSVHRSPRVCVVAAVTLGLLGCSSGLDAQTNQPYDPAVGANQRAGTIDILAALVVAGADGTGTVSATLVSEPGTEPAELTDVSAATLEGDEIDVQIDGSFTVTSQTREPQKLGDSTAEDSAVIVLSGDLAPGDFIEVTFTFARAEPFEVQMPVVARGDGGVYDEVAEASG